MLFVAIKGEYLYIIIIIKNKNMSNKKFYLKPALIILVWVIIVFLSFQSRSLLLDSVETSAEIISDNTESGFGDALYRERFNITSESLSHLVVIELPGGENLEDITSNEWRNYTLFLTFYLNDSLYDLGYDQYFSEPIFVQMGLPEYGESLISESKLVGMINVIASESDFIEGLDDMFDHVHKIRNLLNDTGGLYEFAEDYTGVSTDFYMPKIADVQKVNIVLTGSASNFVDMIEISEQTFKDSEVIAVLVIIVILALVFRTPLGIFIPLVSMVAALFPAYLLTFVFSESGLYSVNDFTPSIIAMIGIAVAVDYNLFSLVRYREEYRKNKAKLLNNDNWNKETAKEIRVESAKKMNKTAGSAVMYSGFTVIIGFSSLMVLGSDFTLSMAIGVTFAVLMSILTARTLTPAILSLWGHILDWPNFMSRASKDVERYKENNNNGGFWAKWSKLVMKRPVTFLVIGMLFMTPFIGLSMQTELSFSFVESLPPGTQSREGFEIIHDNFDLGQLYPYTIIIDGKTINSIWNSDIINQTNALGEWAMNYAGLEGKEGEMLNFSSATSLSFTTNKTSGEVNTMSLEAIEGLLDSPDFFFYPGAGANGSVLIVPNYEKLIWIETSKQYINWDMANNTLIISITANIDAGSAIAWQLVDVIRDKLAELFGDLDVDTYVSGFAASFKDSSDDLYGDVPKMLLVATVLIFLALMVLFRSILLPLKAIFTIGGSILFGLGTLVFIFQNGNLLDITIFNFQIWTAEQAGIAFIIPVFLFTTILGLGMDYSIFIISRIKEEYLKNGNELGESVGIGLSKTAGVVTSAASIMIATFMVFAASPMLIMKTMGLAMAVAILVDATISRIILLPAAMKLAGRWNFWLPKWLDKILPKIEH